jgi:hypothetical protein
MARVFQHPYKYIYIHVYMRMYITIAPRGKRRRNGKRRGGQPEATGTAASPILVLRTSVGGLRFSQALQNENSRHQDLPS